MWKQPLSLQAKRARGHVVETDVEARQAPKGRPVLLVLGGSFTLLAFYLIGIMIWTVVSTPVSPREDAALPDAAVTEDLRPRTEPDMSEVPPANPAYPVPVEE